MPNTFHQVYQAHVTAEWLRNLAAPSISRQSDQQHSPYPGFTGLQVEDAARHEKPKRSIRTAFTSAEKR